MDETKQTAETGSEEGGDQRQQQIVDMGSSTIRTERGTIHTLTIVGQIEGHQVLPSSAKTTKYEHVMPLLAAIEESDEVDGLLVLLNTVGGDIEAGLGIAELIASMSRPTVSLVLGGGHSIGVPLAVSAKRSFIAPSAAMTIHPVRLNGLVIAVSQTFNYFARIQERIIQFVTRNSRVKREDFTRLMLQTGELAADVGSVIYGEEAVRLGLIDEIGSLSDALAYLHQMMDEQKTGAPQNNLRRSLVCCLFMTPPGTKSPRSHPSRHTVAIHHSRRRRRGSGCLRCHTRRIHGPHRC